MPDSRRGSQKLCKLSNLYKKMCDSEFMKHKLSFINIYKTQFIKCKAFIFSSSVLLLCVYTGTTRLHIPLAHPCSYYYLLSSCILFRTTYLYCTSYLLCTFYSIAHFTPYFSSFIFFLPIFIYICSCVVLLLFNFNFYIFLHCPLSGPDLIYISLLIIPCII